MPGNVLQRLGDRIVGDTGRARGGGGRGGVLAVVGTADQRLGRQLVVGRELDPVEPEPAGDDGDGGTLEDAQLRVAVGLEAAVAVDVIGLEVEQHGDVAGELVDVLELERRDLAHDPVRAMQPTSAACRCSPPPPTSRPAARKIAPSSSVVVDLPFVPVTATKWAPVGASSRQPSSSSDQTGTPRALAASTSGCSPGTPGDFTSSVDAVEDRQIVLVAERAVDADHLVTALLEPGRRSPPGSREAVDDRLHGRICG